jgi:hypothetical protein
MVADTLSAVYLYTTLLLRNTMQQLVYTWIVRVLSTPKTTAVGLIMLHLWLVTRNERRMVMPVRMTAETKLVEMGKTGSGPITNPIERKALIKELTRIGNYILNGGMVGKAGRIDGVLGFRIIISVASLIDLPDETYEKMKEIENFQSGDEGVPRGTSNAPPPMLHKCIGEGCPVCAEYKEFYGKKSGNLPN